MAFTKGKKSEIAVERAVQKAVVILQTGKAPGAEAIRSQFKLIASANHPDGGGSVGAGEVTHTMERLQWAKETLMKDLERRHGKS